MPLSVCESKLLSQVSLFACSVSKRKCSFKVILLKMPLVQIISMRFDCSSVPVCLCVCERGRVTMTGNMILIF